MIVKCRVHLILQTTTCLLVFRLPCPGMHDAGSRIVVRCDQIALFAPWRFRLFCGDVVPVGTSVVCHFLIPFFCTFLKPIPPFLGHPPCSNVNATTVRRLSPGITFDVLCSHHVLSIYSIRCESTRPLTPALTGWGSVRLPLRFTSPRIVLRQARETTTNTLVIYTKKFVVGENAHRRTGLAG